MEEVLQGPERRVECDSAFAESLVVLRHNRVWGWGVFIRIRPHMLIPGPFSDEIGCARKALGPGERKEVVRRKPELFFCSCFKMGFEKD
jgi:hypothetical protein